MSSHYAKFPFEFRSLQPDESKLLKKHFSVSFELVRVGPKDYVFSADYINDADDIYNIPLKRDDVIVATFPRSGTTWTQELVWLIVRDLDYEAARATPLSLRYTFIEFSSVFNTKAIDKIIDLNKANGIRADPEYLKQFSKPGAGVLAGVPSPRFIKTHLPLSFLPPSTIDTAKVVYVARDPRDVAVSLYHHNMLFTFVNFTGDFKTYWDLFTKNIWLWTPYFEHLKEAWALRHHPNMLFLFYEELSKDLSAAVHRVASFFGKRLYEEQVVRLCSHLSFENFKKNDSVNGNELEGLGLLAPNESFIRKGKTGGWREYFDEGMAADAERWIADNLRDTDLRFPHFHC